jgi:drug/metabolite transporter (DMT)-like permease
MQKLDKLELRGFMFAGIASLALANSFIFSKLTFKELDFFQFGFWWFYLGTIWNATYLTLRNRGSIWTGGMWYKKLTAPLIIVAILEAIATGLFYYAILLMENPGVVSFIGNIGPVFVTILGLVFLKESFSKTQFAGILLALIGIFILSNKGYHSFSEIFIPGSQYVILASFIFSIATIIARKNRELLDAGVLTLFRAVLLFVSFSFMAMGMSHISIPGFSTFIYLAAGSFLEVFVTILFAYLSLKYIKAYQTSITISTKGLFALLGSWIFLHLQPDVFQISGGLLSLAGVYLVSRKRRGNKYD